MIQQIIYFVLHYSIYKDNFVFPITLIMKCFLRLKKKLKDEPRKKNCINHSIPS